MSMNLLKALLADKGMSIPALADELGLNKTSVWRWNEKRVPIERLIEVERVTGIRRELLRPDIFSAPHPTNSKEDAA